MPMFDNGLTEAAQEDWPLYGPHSTMRMRAASTTCA